MASHHHYDGDNGRPLLGDLHRAHWSMEYLLFDDAGEALDRPRLHDRLMMTESAADDRPGTLTLRTGPDTAGGGTLGGRRTRVPSEVSDHRSVTVRVSNDLKGSRIP